MSNFRGWILKELNENYPVKCLIYHNVLEFFSRMDHFSRNTDLEEQRKPI